MPNQPACSTARSSALGFTAYELICGSDNFEDLFPGLSAFGRDKQAAWMLQYPQWKVKIQGFADDPGSEKQNLALSSKRAEAVMNYLVSKGVPRDRLYAKGYGRDRERLVLNCTDISCKAQNRRVISNPQEDGAF